MGKGMRKEWRKSKYDNCSSNTTKRVNRVVFLHLRKPNNNVENATGIQNEKPEPVP